MDRPLRKEMTTREIVTLMEETVRLIGEVVGELGRYIVERKRLADQASPSVFFLSGSFDMGQSKSSELLTHEETQPHAYPKPKR